MYRAHVPAIYADGRWRSADEIDALARQWRAATLEAIGAQPQLVATVLPATPEGVAVFIALSALSIPVVLVGPDTATWRATRLPPGTSIILLPSLAPLAAAALDLGYVPYVLPEANAHANAPPLTPLSGPGLIMFTSGSTGAPKPVSRSMTALIAGASARMNALGIDPGGGVIVGVTLVHGQGMNMLLSAMLLGGPLAFLPPVNHRAALRILAMPEFVCWRATPHFVDVLGRCELTGPPVVPNMCLISSPIAASVFDRFGERFGVPVRQGYASGETGPIAVDNRPAALVRPGSVGAPLSRVDVCIGDHPASPNLSGEAGRVWIRSPYGMIGYGFPPNVERPGDVDGWWPTRDLARVTGDGLLALAGRIDDCIRTRDGRLVNLAAVADMLRAVASVRNAAVVPLEGSAGASFGAVLECDASVTLPTLRLRLSDALPAWARPRQLALVDSLPTLPNGKPDRRACLDTLNRESA